MSKTALAEVIERLKQLDAAELAEVATRIKLMVAAGASAAASDSSDVDMVLECIADVAESLGLGRTPPPALRKAAQFPAFKAKVPPLMDWLAKAGVIRKVECWGVLCVGLGYLHKDIVRMGATAGTRTLMAQVHRIPDVLDRQFPGYAEAGILDVLTQGRK